MKSLVEMFENKVKVMFSKVGLRDKKRGKKDIPYTLLLIVIEALPYTLLLIVIEC